jgi:phosphoenolpyruvate carboxykinase (GTP)
VLSWILERCAGRGGASDTPIGSLPRPSDLNLAGLDIDPAALGELLSVDKELWKVEATELHSYMDEFGERIPAALRAELHALEQRLSLP